ncbi:unnamed protein product [Adineta steineri]|uniref:Cullin family profile domain-containing protein n=2 Tax=Adineta steineri TaxID=433720 RepID=A0A819QMH2_9BILA|nr:unnamed protein product [Adineta steineri]CAF4031134.1 unnamed protein product [Adineta steineri]
MSQDYQSDRLKKVTDSIDEICNLDDIYDREKASRACVKLYTHIYECFRISASAGPGLIHSLSIDNFRDMLGQDDIDNISNENILQYYKELQCKYKEVFKVLNGGYRYFYNHWLQRQLDTGRTDVYKIDVEIILFFVNVKIHLGDENLIEMMDNTIYTESFQDKFLQTTEDFYRSQEFPSIESNNKMLEYLKLVAEYFDYEINQAKTYLPEQKSTLTTLIVLLETIFFPTDIFNIIVEKLQLLVSDENNYHELAVLFEPIRKLPKLKNELLKLIEIHVNQKAIESISNDLIKKPLLCIEIILNIHGKYLKLIQETFVEDQSFVASFHKVYAKFVKQNPILRRTSNMMTPEEIFARYCDKLLRKRSKAVKNDDWNEKLNNIMIIFNYLNDKYLFMIFYQKMLQERLIYQLSVSKSYEELLISEFKNKCGSEYTKKLEEMFQDIRLSEELTYQFRIDQKNTHGDKISKIYSNNNLEANIFFIDFFSFMVLNSDSWVLSHSSDVLLPDKLKTVYDNFTTFYLSNYVGRKLTLLHRYSEGELQINFTREKHRLKVSTYQMVILLLFNEELTWTFEQIQDKTQIHPKLLLKILSGLLKSDLLISDNPLTVNSRIELAKNFLSNKIRLNINLPSKTEEQKDRYHFTQAAVEERRMFIQAALVRIMKKEQTLKHSLLIQEVIQQLTSRFKPDIYLIETCIEKLIAYEYFQRDSNDNDTLRYLP